MGRELIFDGYWEGAAVYSCDCCGKEEHFLFTDEDEAKNAKAHRKALREEFGWITTQVNGAWKDFCGEPCRNKYIRGNTI